MHVLNFSVQSWKAENRDVEFLEVLLGIALTIGPQEALKQSTRNLVELAQALKVLISVGATLQILVSLSF